MRPGFFFNIFAFVKYIMNDKTIFSIILTSVSFILIHYFNETEVSVSLIL